MKSVVAATTFLLLLVQVPYALATKSGTLGDYVRDETLAYYAIIKKAAQAFIDTPSQEDPATVSGYLMLEVLNPLEAATTHWSLIASSDSQFGFYWNCLDAADLLRQAAKNEIRYVNGAGEATFGPTDEFQAQLQECANRLGLPEAQGALQWR